MSFNLSYFDGFGYSVSHSLKARYNNLTYRQYVTRVALDFYNGEMDEYMYEDLINQGRDPTKVSFTPVNLTKEIVDSICILYREKPIRNIINGTASDKKLWEEIEQSTRLNMKMKKLDRYVHLLGTVLVKVAYRNNSGELVTSKTDTSSGFLDVDLVLPDCFDIKYYDNPYILNRVVCGIGGNFNGFTSHDKIKSVSKYEDLSYNSITKVYWSPDKHSMEDSTGKVYEGINPYNIVPAIPFFNHDPDYYFFLPIDEPLIYMNHAINMRISDLNHIAKYQSFGVPVFKGMERGTSIARNIPSDPNNDLSQGKVFSFGSKTGGRLYRTSNLYNGNALSMSTGIAFGPDTGISTGADGDFKFESPNADLEGLISVINHHADWVRQTYHLTPKALQLKTSPQSGYSLWMEKMGVLENLADRQELFREREEQLFEVIKKVWNVHNPERQFTQKCRLQITYRQPIFPINPKEQLELVERKMEQGFMTRKEAFRELYPHMTEKEIIGKIKEVDADILDRIKIKSDLEKITENSSLDRKRSPQEIAESKSKQKKKNFDPRE